MMPVEVRTGFIDQQHNRSPKRCCDHLNLGQRESGNHQLFLAPRDGISRTALPDRNHKVSPMGTDARRRQKLIPIPGRDKSRRELSTFRPAGLIPELDIHIQQRIACSPHRLDHSLYQPAAALIHQQAS